VICYREPENGRYTSMQTYRRGQRINTLGIEVAVDAILR
jgi:hypothetical protein